MPPRRGHALPASAFVAVFGLYGAVAILPLILGLGAAAAATSPNLAASFVLWARSGGLLDGLWRAMVAAAPLSQPLAFVVVDYVVSLLNLALGIFLVWVRPRDSVARLLAIGMVGTAGAFNLQSHSIYLVVGGVAPELAFVRIVHWILHVTSGVAYLHALLLFPTGRLVPRRLVWLVGLAYLLAVEEIAVSLTGRPGGLVTAPFHLLLRFQAGDPSFLEDVVRSDTAFLVLFFGLLLPLAGVTSQVYRYLAVSTPAERERTRLVVWALLVSLALGVLFVAAAGATSAARGAGVAGGVVGLVEDLTFRLAAPLFAIVPLALFTAIVRHRLFDMDALVTRTLVYGALTAILAGVFLLSLVALQQLLRPIVGGPPELAYAGAGLVNLALFQPLRRRIEHAIDRRVHRRRHAQAAALASFRARLRRGADLAAIEASLLAHLEATLRPSRARLWLRDPEVLGSAD